MKKFNTINVKLTHDDVKHLICGVSLPSYDWIDRCKKLKLGTYTGGFCDRWDWGGEGFNEMTTEELYSLYQELIKK